MKAALFWLCLLIASLASVEGRSLKKPHPVKYNFRLPSRIETRQGNEKWKKEISKEKNIRCLMVDSRTVQCSLVKCPNDDPTCRTFRQVRQTETVQEDRVQKTSTTRKALRSKCNDPTNPLCVHDIWIGKRSDPAKHEENILNSLCDPGDEMCLLAIKRAKESSKMSLKDHEDQAKTGRNLSPSSSSKPACDFIRDPNCKLEGSQNTPPVIKDVLKRLQLNSPTLKRQRACKIRGDKTCRWRPQPNDTDEDQTSSSMKNSKSNTDMQTR